jgi:hypothetical protein
LFSTKEIALPRPAKATPPNPPRRDRSIAGRRAARQKKADRDQKIMGWLNAGVSIPEIAGRQGVTERRMRMLVQDILARRAPGPPAQYVALQVSRLNEALLISFGALHNHNLAAVDRVVKIVRELDRYHGFAAPKSPEGRDDPLFAGPPQAPLALAPPPEVRLDLAPQLAEPLSESEANGAATN